MPGAAGSNEEMVERLEEKGYVETDRVRDAFLAVDRKDFVPGEQRDEAYRDAPLPIEGGVTISAPHMVAINTELLEVEPGNRVFEVGSGSGYQLAVLSELAGEVHGVEILEELVEKSRERLADRENVTIHQGSGLEPVDGNFDRILYSCAIDSLGTARERLEDGGIAVAPVTAGRGQVLRKLEGGEISEHGRVRFVPFEED
jgi:protein-L-isoaspartate(D-aspartate) O-methyltransferase